MMDLHRISRLLLMLTMVTSTVLTIALPHNNGTSSIPTTILSNGISVPLVGLGCASGVRQSHVETALATGYRYLDTAQAHSWGYHEEEVAAALQATTTGSSTIKREDVFVTTKIHPEDLGYRATMQAVKRSLALPGFDGYLDAVLIHKPRCWEGACAKEPEGTWQESWKALETFYREGTVKAIGICDVSSPSFLEELLQQDIHPHIIQNWFDPFHQTPSMRESIQSAGILFQAYSTLGTQWKYQGRTINPVMTSPVLLELSEKYNTTSVAQVVIQWATRQNISVLPASTNGQRQHDNLYASFDFYLSDLDMQRITALDGQAPNPTKPNPDEVSMTFVNPHATRAVELMWVGEDNQKTSLGTISPQQSTTMTTYHGHAFAFYYNDSSDRGTPILVHPVERSQGHKQTIQILRVGGGETGTEDDEEEL